MGFLASRLVRSRHGIFYFRFLIEDRERRISLRTRDPDVAKRLTIDMQSVLQMSKPKKPSDDLISRLAREGMLAESRPTVSNADLDNLLDTGIQIAGLAQWTVQVSGDGGIQMSTDGTQTDHEQAMQALQAILAARAGSQSLSPGIQPSLPALKAAVTVTLKEAIDAYLADKVVSVRIRSVTSARSCLAKLTKAFKPNCRLDLIESRDIDKLRQEMTQGPRPASRDTIENNVSHWRQFWSWASKRYGVEQVVHWVKISDGKAEQLSEGKKKRTEWEAADLSAWFSQDNLDAQVRNDLVWAPILALYTGARLEAICRLKVSDFSEFAPGQWAVRFDPRYDKTNRWRETPLHPDLIEIGLLDYLSDIRKLGDEIFPGNVEQDSRLSHYVSKRFGDLRKAVGVQAGADLHALRATLIVSLAKNGCPDFWRRQFVGHETGDSRDVHVKHYVDKAKVSAGEILNNAVAFIDFQKSHGFIWSGWRYKSGMAGELYRRQVARNRAIKSKK